MIELLLATVLLFQDKPDDGIANGNFDSVEAEATLDERAADSDADAVCELQFIVGARRADQISVRCSASADAAAEAVIAEQVDWRRRHNLDEFSRERGISVTLELDQEADGGWLVRRKRLFSVPPNYPPREIARAATANCRIRYDVAAGQPDVLDVNCITDGSERAFARAARNAVERWIYTRNYNRRCVLVTLEFGIQDPGDARYGTVYTPEDPPCPEEG